MPACRIQVELAGWFRASTRGERIADVTTAKASTKAMNMRTGRLGIAGAWAKDKPEHAVQMYGPDRWAEHLQNPNSAIAWSDVRAKLQG